MGPPLGRETRLWVLLAAPGPGDYLRARLQAPCRRPARRVPVHRRSARGTTRGRWTCSYGLRKLGRRCSDRADDGRGPPRRRCRCCGAPHSPRRLGQRRCHGASGRALDARGLPIPVGRSQGTWPTVKAVHLPAGSQTKPCCLDSRRQRSATLTLRSAKTSRWRTAAAADVEQGSLAGEYRDDFGEWLKYEGTMSNGASGGPTVTTYGVAVRWNVRNDLSVRVAGHYCSLPGGGGISRAADPRGAPGRGECSRARQS